ncbi:MAG: hypothetical protein JWO89_3146 [Verrucomicrobiaceae bacterium]|nr:hypothetical protein [Verrucomicrobiaceae bacterium]MDB6120153.1 hypothetical protein [Verrucomicrobiaceae bacterium]
MFARFFPTLLLLVPGILHAQLAAAKMDFKKDVQPIFAKYCYQCHSVQKKKEKAGFVFDDVQRLSHDVGEGRIIVPGKVDESDLIPIVLGSNGKKEMPPDGDKLTMPEVQKLRQWISEGANMPGVDIAAKMARQKRERPHQVMNWTSKEGKAIKASFEAIEGEFVLLRMQADNKVYKVPLAKLNPAGQIQAKLQAE